MNNETRKAAIERLQTLRGEYKTVKRRIRKDRRSISPLYYNRLSLINGEIRMLEAVLRKK